jgi:glycosyltransferase involved in cell wall biosynthesis
VPQGFTIFDGAGDRHAAPVVLARPPKPPLEICVILHTETNDVPAALPRHGQLLSVVVPAYNEAAVLAILHQRLVSVLAGLDILYEVIYVDDGSTDETADLVKQLRLGDSRIGLVRFSRNFGKEVALTAGLQSARGDCVVLIDADLQDPPELIPAMVSAWLKGADVVNMRRRYRAGETWFKKFSAHVFYRTLNRLTEVPIPEDVGDFRLLSRRAVKALNDLPERNRYMKGLFAWVGFRQVTIVYDRDARAAGPVKQNYAKLLSLAIEGITSFSVIPLRVASLTGVLSAGAAFAMMFFYIIKAVVMGEPVRGFPTLIVAVLLLGGLQLLSMGILGEYLGRMFMETKRRPLYLIDEQIPPEHAEAESLRERLG